MSQTFYLSNISPQVPRFNRGYWKKLEKHVRDLTKEYDVVRVVTGPLYLPHEAKDGKKYVTYEVIGKNDAAVPTHFFKLISAWKGNSFSSWGYILPNQEIESSTPLDAFKTTTQKVTQVSGIIFNN
jgi:endonuclease G